MYLILALLLLAIPAEVPSDQTTPATRDVVAKGLDKFDSDVQKLERIIEARFDADVSKPQLGVTTESAEVVGADGLHAITVARVLIDGPADVAGILAGDRIMAVGPRRITHETEQVFRLITDGASGPIALTVLREGTERTITVNRAPLACLQRSANRIDLSKWRSKIADLRRLSDMIRAELNDESITPDEMRYRAAKDHVVAAYGLIGELGQAFLFEMVKAAETECALRSP